VARLVFVDTSAWVAISDTNEARHTQAVEHYIQLLKANARLITTCLVVAETQILLRRRLGRDAAMTFLKSVNDSPRTRIVYPEAQTERLAKHVLDQYTDHDFSLTDAISFVLMREMEIIEAFTYDKHFIVMGFTSVT